MFFLGDQEMPLDEVRSEGLRQWNMDMDVEYQYETFNGLPVYCGGDMHGSEDPEEYDPLEMARAVYVTYILLGCVYWNGLVCRTLEFGMMTM